MEDHVLAPEDVYERPDCPIGPGSISMNEIDGFVLYRLYEKETTRSLKSYVNWLFYYTGTIVLESTLSRFFNHGFPIRGGLCKPNPIHMKKSAQPTLKMQKSILELLPKLIQSGLSMATKSL